MENQLIYCNRHKSGFLFTNPISGESATPSGSVAIFCITCYSSTHTATAGPGRTPDQEADVHRLARSLWLCLQAKRWGQPIRFSASRTGIKKPTGSCQLDLRVRATFMGHVWHRKWELNPHWFLRSSHLPPDHQPSSPAFLEWDWPGFFNQKKKRKRKKETEIIIAT